MKLTISALALVLSIAVASPVLAGQANMKKLSKKWPKMDAAWARSFDVWMTDDELSVFEKLASTDERKAFLEQAGYWKMWESIQEEMLPHVIEGKVVEGMTRDEVLMVWDKPEKIRKDFTPEAYVNELHYKFEADKKGNLKRLEGDEYNKDIRVMIVLELDGLVAAVVSTEDLADRRDAAIAQKKAKKEAREATRPTFEGEPDVNFTPPAEDPEAAAEGEDPDVE